MNTQGWLYRLGEQLPGWHIWCSSPRPRWNAVMADPAINHDDALYLPGRVTAETPQHLRTLCVERYGGGLAERLHARQNARS